jgi:hypothetical protein
MGKVLWHVTMSLDGFITGPNDSMDWVFDYISLDALTRKLGPAEPPHPADFSAIRGILEETIRSTGSVLSGRRSYNVGRKPGQRPEAQKVLGGAGAAPYSCSHTKLPKTTQIPRSRSCRAASGAQSAWHAALAEGRMSW